MDLGEHIKRKRKADKISADGLATLIGVAKENIYKWEKGTKPSDPKDYEKVKAWLEGKLESIPIISEKEKPGSVDYQAKYIQKLEENEAFLKRLLESNLIDLADRQRTIQAEVQAIQQWDAQVVAEGDQVKAEAALGHIRALVAGNREKLSKNSIAVDKGT